eukprot:6316862-Lingulodinium_polyedra.AAC.1
MSWSVAKASLSQELTADCNDRNAATPSTRVLRIAFASARDAVCLVTTPCSMRRSTRPTALWGLL